MPHVGQELSTLPKHGVHPRFQMGSLVGYTDISVFVYVYYTLFLFWGHVYFDLSILVSSFYRVFLSSAFFMVLNPQALVAWNYTLFKFLFIYLFSIKISLLQFISFSLFIVFVSISMQSCICRSWIIRGPACASCCYHKIVWIYGHEHDKYMK